MEFSVQPKTTTKKLCIADAGVIRYSEKNDFIKKYEIFTIALAVCSKSPRFRNTHAIADSRRQFSSFTVVH